MLWSGKARCVQPSQPSVQRRVTGKRDTSGGCGSPVGSGRDPRSVTNTLLWTRVPLATEYFITGVRGVLHVIVQKGSAKEIAGGSEGGVSLVTDEEL